MAGSSLPHLPESLSVCQTIPAFHLGPGDD